jgi:hypothetical protein
LGGKYREVKTRQLLPVLQERLNTLKNTSPDKYGGLQGRLNAYLGMEQPIGKVEYQQLLALRVEINQAAGLAGPRGPTDLLLGLEAVQDAHKQAAQHNARYVRNVEQARSAAQRIVGDDGRLVPAAELGWDDIKTVQGEIAASPEQGLPQSVHALKMLKKLQEQPELQEVIESIKAPDPGSPACGLIRSVLNLPADFPVSKAEARRAAIASLLTKLRQHDVGSCFATSVAIQAQEKVPDVFLKDVKSLIETGTVVRSKTEPTQPLSDSRAADPELHKEPAFAKALDALGVPGSERQAAIQAALTRLTKGDLTPARVLEEVQKAAGAGWGQGAEALKKALDEYRDVGKMVMPLNPDASRSDLTTPARIPRARGKFHETPAIVAALDALGIPVAAREKTVNAALGSLRGGLDKSLTEDLFTPEQVLEKIVALRGVRDVEETKRELDAAKLAFQAQQENVLLRAWEYTVASMAEADEVMGKEVRGPAYLAADKALKELCETLDAEGTDTALVDQFYRDFSDKFHEVFQQQVAIRFDASVMIPKSADGNSTAGTWVMRRKKDDSKVNDQTSQEKMVKDLLAEVTKQFQGTPNWPFAYRVVESSRDKALSAGPPPQPGGAPMGGMLAAFYNNPEPVELTEATPGPGNAADLLAWVIEQNKALHDTSRDEIDTDPGAATLPMHGSSHIFNMKPGAPGLRALTDGLQAGKTAQDVVKEYADKHKGTKDTPLPLDPDDPDSQVMRFVARACEGLHSSWADMITGRLREWKNGYDDIQPAELKQVIDNYFLSDAADLDQQRQDQKAKSREGVGKNLLADTSASAPAVPLDLADGSRLMGLVGEALSACEPQAVAGLTADAVKSLQALGGDKVTLAQVKEVIDRVIATGYKKHVLDAEMAAVRGAPAQEGDLRGNSPLLKTWVENAFGGNAAPTLVENALARLPKARTAFITFSQIQDAALKAIEDVRSPELDQKQDEIRGNAEAALAVGVSNSDLLLADSTFDLSAAAPRTKLDVTADPALARLDATLDAALADLNPSDIPAKKKAVWARLEAQGDAVSLDRVRDELDKLLEGDQKEKAKRNFSKNLLADTSATAPAVPFDLKDNSRLMSLVSDALSKCGQPDVEGLTEEAVKILEPLGGDKVTLAQVKGVIDQVVTASFTKLNPGGGAELDQKLKDLLAKSETDLADAVGGWDRLLADSKVALTSTPRTALDATLDAALAHLDEGVRPGKKTALWARIEKLGGSVTLAQVRDELDKLFDEDQKKADEADTKALQDGITGRLAAAVLQELQPPQKPGEHPGIVFADSNWEDSASDNEVLFTMVVNPLTGELEMWQVNADGSDPRPMDQAEWVSGKFWATPKNPAQTGPLV